MDKIKEKRTVDIEAIRKLIKEAGVSIYQIEHDLGIGKSIVLRGVKPDTPRPLPPKWELPIIKYLKKKIAEKKDVEAETIEVLKEVGIEIPEKESSLKEDMKAAKKEWLNRLQKAVI